MKYFQILAVVYIAVLFQQAFAVETSMTQEAKQQALDSLASYEQQQITQLSTQSNQAPTNTVHCVGESCIGVQRPAQSDEVYEAGKPMMHQVHLYFINDSAILSGYQYREEDFFRLKEDELNVFKDTVFSHYLGTDYQKYTPQLRITRPKYVGIKVYITQEDLEALVESDVRISDISHKGNSSVTVSY